MPGTASHTVEKVRQWPLTSDARSQLIEEIARVREDLLSLTGQGLEEGILHLPVALKARRLETLKDVLDRAQIIDDMSCAAVGRRATLQDDEGELMTFEIVFPGDGDPTRGCVSPDSPLGGAILGAQAGEVVEVSAPEGRWSVTVISID